MKLELKVYPNTEKEKVYAAETLDLSLGIVEDFCDSLDIETLNVNDIADLSRRIIRARKQITPILHDMFGASEEEIRTVRTTNLAAIFKELYAYVTEKLEQLPEGSKKNE